MLMRALTMEPFMGATTMHPSSQASPRRRPRRRGRTSERPMTMPPTKRAKSMAQICEACHIEYDVEDRFAQSNGDDAEAGAPAAGVENTMMNAICKTDAHSIRPE